MKDKWTIDYRNWIGASTIGLMFLRARKGSGKWRKARELPPHVVQYLHLDLHGRQWVLSGVSEKTLMDGGQVTFAARKANRIYCNINVPEKKKAPKSYAPFTVGRYLPDYEGPWHLYRTKYKYTDCGPSLGIRVTTQDRPIYCSSLPSEWDALPGRIVEFLISSIVEGVDTECETIEVPCYPLATLNDRIDAAVDATDREAKDIWNATHGCPKCGPEFEGCRPINPKCKACKGLGVVL
jgi:hypothetical protein